MRLVKKNRECPWMSKNGVAKMATVQPSQPPIASNSGQQTLNVPDFRNVLEFFGDLPDQPTHLIRDPDSKFTRQFDDLLEADGMEVVRVGPCAPHLNAFAERYVLSIKSEWLDNFILLGEDHLRHIVAAYDNYYNEHRPHQGTGNVPIAADPEPPARENSAAREVLCQERLGGLLKHYYHRAA
jgi:putative transposase